MGSNGVTGAVVGNPQATHTHTHACRSQAVSRCCQHGSGERGRRRKRLGGVARLGVARRHKVQREPHSLLMCLCSPSTQGCLPPCPVPQKIKQSLGPGSTSALQPKPFLRATPPQELVVPSISTFTSVSQEVLYENQIWNVLVLPADQRPVGQRPSECPPYTSAFPGPPHAKPGLASTSKPQ